MAASTGEVVIEIKGDSSDFEQEVKKAGDSASDLGDKAKNAGGDLDKLGDAAQQTKEDVDGLGDSSEDAGGKFDGLKDKFSDLAGILTGSALMDAADQISIIGDKLQELGDKAVEAYSQTESTVSKVNAYFGETGEAAETSANVIKSVYTSGVGDSMEAVGDAVLLVKQNLGDLSETDMTNLTTQALTLDELYGIDMSETLRGVNSLMENYGLTAQEAMDYIVAGTQNGLDKTNELGDNLSEYSGKFSQAGYSAEEYFQLLTNGLDGGAYNLDKVNDAINEVTTRLADGTIEENLGLYSTRTQELFEAWQNGEATQKDVIDSIVSDISSCTNQQDALNMAAQAFGTMAEDGSLQFIESLTTVGDTYDDVSGKAQGLTDATTTPMQEMESSMRQVQEALAPLGEKLLELANTVLPVLVSAVETVSGWFNSLPEPVQNFVVILGTLVVAFTALTPVIAAIAVAVLALNTSLLPIIAVIAAIAAAVTIVIAVIQNWSTITQAFSTLWSTVWTTIQNVASTVMNAISSTISAVWNAISNTVSTVLNTISSTVSSVWNAISSTVSSVLNAISSVVSSVWNAISSTVSSVLNAISSTVSSVWNAISSTISSVLNAISSTVSNIWNAISSTISSVLNAISSTVSSIWNAISSTISSVLDAISSTVSSVWNAISSTVSSVLNAISSTVSSVWNTISSTVSSVLNAISSTVSSVWNAISSTVSSVLNTISSTVSSVWNAISSTVSSVLSGISSTVSSIWSSIQSTVSEKINAAREAVSSAVEAIRSSVSEKFNAAKSLATDIFDSIRSKIKEKIEAAKDAVKTAIDKIKSFFNFSWSLPKLKLPHISISGSFSLNPPSVPHFSISWYKKGGVLLEPTIFGALGSTLLAGGEAGPEAVAPISVLQDYVSDAVQDAIAASADRVQRAVDEETVQVSAVLAEPISGSGQEESGNSQNLTMNIYVEGSTSDTQEARDVGRELGRETARELRRRGYATA